MSKKDSVLKKEFKKQDVERMRNLIQGKHGAKTRSSMGFSKKEIFHSEGDIWEEDGRKWTIKEGIKQNITKLDKAKIAHSVPLFCPKCKKVMNKRNDKPYYNIHKMCFDCIIDFEMQLRKEGKWEEYERNIYNKEIDHFIEEYKLWVQDRLDESNHSFVSESGEVEKWDGKINKKLVSKSVAEVIEYLESLKK